MIVSQCARLFRLLPMLGLPLLAACTVGPDFHPPTVVAPSVWGREDSTVPGTTSTAAIDPNWWETFHDPELTTLVGRLVEQNLSLREAAERIVQGRAERRIAAAQGLPHLEDQAQMMRQRMSPNGLLSLIQPAPDAPLDYDDWRNGIQASWELDLFGRVRRQVEAQNADLQAQIEDRRAIALAAISELAQDYMQFRGIQARLAIAQATLELAKRNTELVQTRFANGAATTLDIAQATGQQASISATVAPLEAQQAAAINAIGLLLALPPRTLEAELEPPAPIPTIPGVVPIGLPGTLVRRRPDVREAEARLHAATAQTGVAVAAFYPDVSLTGLIGGDGRAAVNAFSLPSRMYMVGPQISIPIFQGGQLRGQLNLRKSQQREAALSFQQVVLRAWSEVDDALTAYNQAQRARQDVVVSVRQDQVALAAARQRYQEGAADFLNVVSAQTALLSARDSLAASDTQLASDLVALYRALGGGWEVAEGKAKGAAHRSTS